MTFPRTQSLRSTRPMVYAALLLLAGTVLTALSIANGQQNASRQLVQPPSEAEGSKRIALVIGNSAYTTAPALKNPTNDARDMAIALKSLGFEVSSGTNVSQREMKRLIREFGQRLKTGGHGLFYYAGHGVQARGHNYMIPVDADIQSEADVEDSGVDVNLVLSYMDDAQNRLNIVILDACRNNPFARSFRSATEGLAQVDAPTGTLIAYATAPGRVAADGVGENGLYTAELLKAMRVPGLTATEMFMQVRREVMARTASKQVPWEASSLTGAFYFTPRGVSADNSTAVAETSRPIEPTVSKAADAATFELSYWDTIKSSTEPQDFISYLEKYPKGQFVELARRRAGAKALAAAAETHNKKGNEFHKNKDYAAAETEYRTAIAFSPHSVYHNNLANTLKAAGKPGETEERRESLRLKEVELQEAVRSAPNDQWRHRDLAVFYKEQKRLPEAENSFREAVRISNYDAYSTGLSELRDLYNSQKRHTETEALLREVVRANTVAARGSGNARLAHAMLGKFLADQNRLSEAESVFRTALTFEPDDLGVVYDLTAVLVKQNKIKDSDNEWKSYIKRKPEYGPYSYGLHLTEQKRWADAEVQFREALRISPDEIDKLMSLVKVLQEQKKTSAAEAELKKFAARKPSGSIYSELGRFYVKEQRWADAEGAFRESIRIEPSGYTPLDELVSVLKNQKKYKEVELELRAVIARNPTASNHQKLGTFLESIDRWGDAEASFREALRMESTSSNQGKVVDMLMAQQKFEAAENEWKSFLRTKPDAWGYWLYGNFLRDRNRIAEAEAAYSEGTKLAPTAAYNFQYLGTTLMTQKKFAEAEAAFRSARRNEPSNPNYVSELARSLLKQNKSAEAEAEMKALVQQTNNAYTRDLFAHFLTDQKRFSEAEVQVREAIRLEPYYHRYSKLGEILEQQNKLPEAEAAFKEAIRSLPGQSYAYSSFAQYLKRRERWSEAEAQFREAFRLEPAPLHQRIDFAFVLAKQNKTVEAEQEYKLAEAYFRKLLLPRPLNQYYRHSLGLALEGQNRVAEAEKEYAEAVRLDPESTEYNESLQRVRNKTKTP